MQFDRYEFIKDDKRLEYEFYSEGPRGLIKKKVSYSRLPGIKTKAYNLSFGDWDDSTHNVNDKITSNNNDRDKILRTVAFTVLNFIEDHPDAYIFMQGSTEVRTRLYQMNIRTFWKEINIWFIVRGYVDNQWQTIKQGINYSAFLLEPRKQLTFDKV